MHSMGEQNRPERSRVRAVVVPGLALTAVIAGALLTAGGAGETGWFAYAPLSNAAFIPDSMVFLGSSTKAGLATLAAGLLVLAFWSGYRTGRQR